MSFFSTNWRNFVRENNIESSGRSVDRSKERILTFGGCLPWDVLKLLLGRNLANRCRSRVFFLALFSPLWFPQKIILPWKFPDTTIVKRQLDRALSRVIYYKQAGSTANPLAVVNPVRKFPRKNNLLPEEYSSGR